MCITTTLIHFSQLFGMQMTVWHERLRVSWSVFVCVISGLPTSNLVLSYVDCWATENNYNMRISDLHKKHITDNSTYIYKFEILLPLLLTQ